MGSVSFASIFVNGYRRVSIPVALMRTLSHTDTHVSLSEHFHKLFQVSGPGSPAGSNKTTFSCQSTKQDVINTNTVSSLNGNPEYDRLLPCPLHHVPPRVEHMVVTEGGRVLEYISKALDLPPLSYPFWSCTLCSRMSKASSNCNFRASATKFTGNQEL